MNIRELITSDDPVKNIRDLKEKNELYNIFKFPEGYLEWDMDQQTPHHELTVYEHTLEALGNLQIIFSKYLPNTTKEDKLVANFAILFHDLGKLNPKIHGYKVKDGVRRRTYYNHEEYSIKAARHILFNLPDITPDEVYRITRLIDAARRVNPNYTPSNETCNLSRKGLAQFARFAQDDWLLAVFVGLADATAKKKNLLATYSTTYYADMIDKLRTLAPEVMAIKPLLSEDEIINVMGMVSLKRVEEIQERMVLWQFINPKVSKKDAFGFVQSFKNGKK